MTSISKGDPIPESIGLTADEYHDVRELRLAMQKEVDAVEEREKELKESIINRLSKANHTGEAGLRYRAQITMKVSPRIANWGDLCDYIKMNGRFDLLQKRLSNDAVKGVWEAGEEIIGVDKFNAPDVSITKI